MRCAVAARQVLLFVAVEIQRPMYTLTAIILAPSAAAAAVVIAATFLLLEQTLGCSPLKSHRIHNIHNIQFFGIMRIFCYSEFFALGMLR